MIVGTRLGEAEDTRRSRLTALALWQPPARGAAWRVLGWRPMRKEMERRVPRDELIVSKTDLAGRITYANRAFLEIAGFSAEELIGKPHNVVRHPLMPRGVFKLMWEELHARRDVWAHVLNRTRDGDRYWVVACVTPSFNGEGEVVGYHSTRRAPSRAAIPVVAGLYRHMLDLERGIADPRHAARTSRAWLGQHLEEQGTTLTDLVFQLELERRAA